MRSSRPARSPRCCRCASIAARIGRRGVMLGAVATMIAAAALLAAWKALPGLLLGRLITGVAVGLAAGTAITYLIELRVRAGPERLGGPRPEHRHGRQRRRTRHRPADRRLSGGMGQAAADLALPALGRARSGRADRPGRRPRDRRSGRRGAGQERARGSSKSARLLVPAALATLAAFSANGLFAGLSGLFLATTFGRPSHALAGATLFLVFSAGVASQLATDGTAGVARPRARHRSRCWSASPCS